MGELVGQAPEIDLKVRSIRVAIDRRVEQILTDSNPTPDQIADLNAQASFTQVLFDFHSLQAFDELEKFKEMRDDLLGHTDIATKIQGSNF